MEEDVCDVVTLTIKKEVVWINGDTYAMDVVIVG